MDMLRSDVSSELSIMEDALAMRMRNIIAGSSTSIQHLPALDLAGLHIISQVFLFNSLIHLIKSQHTLTFTHFLIRHEKSIVFQEIVGFMCKIVSARISR